MTQCVIFGYFPNKYSRSFRILSKTFLSNLIIPTERYFSVCVSRIQYPRLAVPGSSESNMEKDGALVTENKLEGRQGKLVISNKLSTRVQLLDGNLPVLALFAKRRKDVNEEDWRVLKLEDTNVLITKNTQEFIGASKCYLEYDKKGEVIIRLHLSPPEEMDQNEWRTIMETLYRKNI